jgi:hypothetical protein
MKCRIIVSGTFRPKYYGPFTSVRAATNELRRKGWTKMKFFRGRWSRNEESDPETTKVAEVVSMKMHLLAPSELPRMN